MGKNYSYRITFDPDNPRHMRVAALLDGLGRGELRQYVADCIVLAEAITSQQKAAETPGLPAIPQAAQQQPAPQVSTEPSTQAVEHPDPQAEQRAWAQDSFKAFL